MQPRRRHAVRYPALLARLGGHPLGRLRVPPVCRWDVRSGYRPPDFDYKLPNALARTTKGRDPGYSRS